MRTERVKEMRNWDWLRLSNKLKPVRGKIYISETERRKCRRVAAVFSDMYEHENLLVLDAGRYGFVKLNDFRESSGFVKYILLQKVRSYLRIYGRNGSIRS